MHIVHHRRQVPGAPPSAPGINSGNALTVNPDEATTASSGLVVDPSAEPGAGITTAPQLAATHTAVVTLAPSPTPTPADSPSSDPSSSATESDAAANVSSASSAQPIALGTVVGSCVGAFIGAVALISLAFWFYRRYSRSLKKYGSPRGPINARADQQRRRSHLEPWDKLEDNTTEDKWAHNGSGGGGGVDAAAGYAGVGVNKKNSRRSAASKNTSQESDEVPPMEKFTMFKKTLSIRTTYTNAEPLEMSYPISSMPKVQSQSPVILSTEKNNSLVSTNPYLNLSSSKADVSHPQFSFEDSSSFAMAQTSQPQSYPTPDGSSMAIPTPPATSPLHRWESAEIIHVDGPTAETIQAAISNPFADDANAKSYNNKAKESSEWEGENRKSLGGNPFFGGHGEEDIMSSSRRSRSGSVVSSPRSRSNSVSASSPLRLRSGSSATAGKGKGRPVVGNTTSNPFGDENVVVAAKEKPVIPAITTTNWSNNNNDNVSPATRKPTSPPLSPLKTPQPTFMHHIQTDSNEEQALASILDALGDPSSRSSEEAKLRIASMQSSVGSVYTTVGTAESGYRESYGTTAAVVAAYSYGEERESRDVTNDFPLPPASPGVAVGMGMPVAQDTHHHHPQQQQQHRHENMREDAKRASYLSYA